jgi:GH15 family glucan-1,4-alpha-glucosidase
VHTSSALMSWAACDRLAKIAATLQLAERASHWQQHADRMRAEILDQSWCEERQAFAESLAGRAGCQRAADGRGGSHRPKDPRL